MSYITSNSIKTIFATENKQVGKFIDLCPDPGKQPFFLSKFGIVDYLPFLTFHKFNAKKELQLIRCNSLKSIF